MLAATVMVVMTALMRTAVAKVGLAVKAGVTSEAVAMTVVMKSKVGAVLGQAVLAESTLLLWKYGAGRVLVMMG